ncbi:glycosyltransferase family 2 protein [Microvirga massiliensis]|uniref:glycosyltransferase family 2 protein n=1 Tax=Microvirga massiliensis TaxID=1033741 RepID=UPI00062B8835|nr:glycosyltransferase [Microvirga massiliensis]
MVQYFLALAPTFLVAAYFLIFALNWSRHRTWTRAITCAVVLAVASRYLIWRFTETVRPMEVEQGFAFYWVWFLFLVEVLAFSELALFLVAMSRYADRSKEADRLETEFFQRPDDALPTVDVFIPTYDEPLDVLERTIVGALALDYPKGKLKVYVLDDQRRDWLRSFCEQKGAIHVVRGNNAHAKAGNLNNGLKVSSGKFIAIFDADFVPYRNFLRRTLPFFTDPSIGIVQTPQHFFNKDPVQSNLSLERVWPDEQRLFFDEMAASRDAWDVSFCCGSCSVSRRIAVEAIGGFPTESITEDLLTTLSMLNKGYKTRYLNERLSMGLAAESLKGYFVQRERWCQGGIQTLYLHNGPLRGPGLTLFQRIMFLPLSWLVQYFVRLAILIVPAVYLWTGAPPLYFTSVEDIVSYQAPVLVTYFLLMVWLTPTRYLPMVSSAVGAFSTFRMLPVVISSVIKPFGKPFRVTPKGSGSRRTRFDAYTFACIATLIAVTALGLIISIVPEWSRIGEGEFSVISGYWAGVNIVVLVIASLICFERPRPLLDSFLAEEPGLLTVGGRILEGRIVSISLDGALMEIFKGTTALRPGQVILRVEGVESFTARIAEIVHDDRTDVLRVRLSYDLQASPRDQMIVKLYTGGYSQDIREIDKSAIVSGLWSRAFGADTADYGPRPSGSQSG